MNHTLMTPEKARKVATEWILRSDLPLGVFAKTGMVEDHGALLQEIDTCIREIKENPELYKKSDLAQVQRLRRFVEKSLRRDDWGRLVAPWANTSMETDK